MAVKLNEIRNNFSIQGKNGIGFLLSALIVWLIITILFSSPITITQKNIFMLFATGLTFPLSVGISNVIKAVWKFSDNELGVLGLYLNLAQLIYFPIFFWGIIHSPANAVMLFAIITGAHFFPYGWFYNAKPYYIIAPIISVFILLLTLYLNGEKLWLIPLAMVILLASLVCFLLLDYKRKLNKL